MPEVYLLDTNVICALADANRPAHATAVRQVRGVWTECAAALAGRW